MVTVMNDENSIIDLAALISGMDFLNYEKGRKCCLNDDEFYMEILKEFVEESKLHILQESYRQQDWSKYRISMHTIKSSAAYIAAEELSKQARLMEKAAKEGNLPYILDKHAEFIAYYQAVLQGIGEGLAKADVQRQ